MVNSEKYNQIIGEVYEKYSIIAGVSTQVEALTKEEFINKIKTDSEFAKTWGLKIKERELSNQERSDLKNSPPYKYGKPANGKLINERLLDSNKVPTKLITITYNNETIEKYEYEGK
jgi:hypothetical protein